MSEVMRGVLLMPPSLWSGDPLDVQQRHSVYRAAAARINALDAEVERLRAQQVVCLRCGHENWIMKGKAPAQITEADKAAAQQAEPVACNEQITVEELAAALGWPGGISDPVLNKAELLAMVASTRRETEQEPAAWLHDKREYVSVNKNDIPKHQMLAAGWTPLYTAPPRREWVSLTYQERAKIIEYGYKLDDITRAIEAALKEKNHG